MPEQLKDFMIDIFTAMAKGASPSEVLPTKEPKLRPERVVRYKNYIRVKNLIQNGLTIKEAIYKVATDLSGPTKNE